MAGAATNPAPRLATKLRRVMRMGEILLLREAGVDGFIGPAPRAGGLSRGPRGPGGTGRGEAGDPAADHPDLGVFQRLLDLEGLELRIIRQGNRRRVTHSVPRRS